MNINDFIRWVLKSLWMQKARTSLTILGFAIGISAMSLLSAFGEGLRQFVMDEFSQFGTHIIAVTPGKTETFGVGGVLNTTRPLSLADASNMLRLPGVEKVVPVIAGTAQMKVAGKSRYSNVYGVGPSAGEAWQLTVGQGSFLPEEGFENSRAFAVLGATLKNELFGGKSALGQYIHVGGSRFRVVGVTLTKGDFMGQDLDDAIYIPANRALQLFNRESLMEIDVFYSPALSSEGMSEKIKKLLINRHGFEDFTITTQDEMLGTMDNILRILKFAGAGLGAISLLVGGVGIATILMITVTERTAEVGLLRALGSTRNQVRNLFLGEAVALGLLGGIAGLLVVLMVVVGLAQVLPKLPVALGLDIVFAALLVSILIGLIAGLNPAMKATQLSPIDALRAE